MKTLTALASLFAVAAAQTIEIGAPTPGQQLPAGHNLTVTITKPDSISPSQDIAVAILLHHCLDNPCEDVTQMLGDTLYSGSYDAQFASGEWDPFENFTVLVPSAFESGLAVLSVVHIALVGAGPWVLTEIKNVTVDVV